MKINGLLQAEEGRSDLVDHEEISARQYYDIAIEPDGNFWVATSDGLFRYAPTLWRSPAVVRKISSTVRCLAADQEGRIWMAAAGKVFSLQNGRVEDYSLGAVTNSALQVRSFFPLKNNILLLSAEDPESNTGEQLFIWQQNNNSFTAVKDGETGMGWQRMPSRH